MGRMVAVWALMTMAAMAAGVSCDAVFGIEQFEGGPPEDAGLDVGRDGKAGEAATEAGDSGTCVQTGQTRCVVGGFVTCTGGKWSSVNQCIPGQICSGGACMATPNSCVLGGAGLGNCGPAANESCCGSPEEVPGGTQFDRSYDGLSSGYTSTAYPASVSAFRLDGYEITVGRFRQFVTAVVGGFTPGMGTGKHSHLNGGAGLNATGGGNELGWEPSWDSNLATTTSAWDGNLAAGTWTPAPKDNENLPITQITWYEAYAFCIWDGGFLPSEAEWNFAAAGGSEQRAYPWSIAFPPGSNTPDCMNANTGSCPAPDGMPSAVGSTSPAGDGEWGQSDLAGNVWEWTLDWHATYTTPCMDCADLTPTATRVDRGGSFMGSPSLALVSTRNSANPAKRNADVGARCARIPP
jgi:sulfatase modifying factor 1